MVSLVKRMNKLKTVSIYASRQYLREC